MKKEPSKPENPSKTKPAKNTSSSHTFLLTLQKREVLSSYFLQGQPEQAARQHSEIFHRLAKKANEGDREALYHLHEIASKSTEALYHVHNLEALRELAPYRWNWPVLASESQAEFEVMRQRFKVIGLGTKYNPIDIGALMKHGTPELLWAIWLFENIREIQQYMQKYGCKTIEFIKSELGAKNLAWSLSIWPFSAWPFPTYPSDLFESDPHLDMNVLAKCEKLSLISTDESVVGQWWAVAKKIFETATNNEPERRPEFQRKSKTDYRANAISWVKNHAKNANETTIIARMRNDILSKVRSAFVRHVRAHRIEPEAKNSPPPPPTM